MTISTKDWLAYINKLSMLDKTAAAKMQAYVAKHGFGDTEALIDYAYSIATKYGEGSAALAAEMYDVVTELAGEHLPPAVPAPTPEYGEVAKAVNGTAKYRNVELVSNAVGRLVKRTGVDTTMKNAIRDGAQWAWIPHGDTCAFCLTLASRGWQPASKAALKGGHAEHIHAHCDCTYAISFNGKPKYASYDPDKYLEMYENAEGNSSKDKINSLRRQKYQQNKDKINAQKRAAYADRKGNRINLAKAAELFGFNDEEYGEITPESIAKELETTEIGRKATEWILQSGIKPLLTMEERPDGGRGSQEGREVKIFLKNNRNTRIAAEAVIHEMAHYRFHIGECQHAEAVCYSFEKMHAMNRAYLFKDEWDDIVEMVKREYSDYPWESPRGGYFEQFHFVRERT